MRSARIAAIGFSLLLAFPGLSSISALDLREIDEHLEYLDRPLVSFYSKPMQIEGEPYLYSLIGVIATLEEALVDRPDDVQILRRLGDAYRISAATDINKLLIEASVPMSATELIYEIYSAAVPEPVVVSISLVSA